MVPDIPEFPYVLTLIPRLPFRFDGFMLNLDEFTTPENAEQLNLTSGNIDSLLFLFRKPGTMYTLTPRTNKTGYSSVSSPFLEEIFPVEELANQIKINIKEHNNVFRGNPRAIVYFSQENKFLSVAREMGYNPKKISEKFFLTKNYAKLDVQ